MTESSANEFPIDLGLGYRARWDGSALWVFCPHLAKVTGDDFFGVVRIPTEGEKCWNVIELDPLTLMPSIKVFHGVEVAEHFYITKGKVELVGESRR